MKKSIDNFKRIPLFEAARIYKIDFLPYYLKDVYNEDDIICIAEEDAHFDELEVDSFFNSEEFIGVIFCKDLSAAGNIIQKDRECGPLFIVLGDVAAQNIYVSGSNVFFRGCVKADKTLVCGVYNHGVTAIKGEITAEVLVSLDHMFQYGEINISAIFIKEYWRHGLQKDDNYILLKEGILVDDEESGELYFDKDLIFELVNKNESLLKK
jgi:hypothetical protein